MRIRFLLFLVLYASVLNGQTDSIEKAILYNKMISKEMLTEDYSKIGIKWNETIKKINKYPDLPLTKDGKVDFSFIYTYKDIGKNVLFNRTLEWLSITYGLIPSYLYSDRVDGKIICTNNFSANNNTTCNYAMIITIMDRKSLIEFENLDYQIRSGGYYSGDTWVPEKNNNFSIYQVFPVILKKSTEWEPNLNILKATKERFNNDVTSLNDYITGYESKYVF
jgi:hypothetical protein